MYACIDLLSFDAAEQDVEQWINQVNSLNFSYQRFGIFFRKLFVSLRLSKLSSEIFWSTVCYNINFLISFDSALECIPRGHSLERYQLVYRWNEGAQKAVEALRFQIFIIYCRIHVFPPAIVRNSGKSHYSFLPGFRSNICRMGGMHPESRNYALHTSSSCLGAISKQSGHFC